MKKILMAIIPMLIVSMLFVGCGKKEETETGSTTVPAEVTTTEESKTNEVISSDDTTTSTEDEVESKLVQYETINQDTEVYQYKTGNTEFAENIINASLYYEGKTVTTIIKIGSLSSDKTYATSEETFNSIDGPLCITFKKAISAKEGDIIRVEGKFDGEKFTDATVVETNGDAKTEFEAHVKEREDIEKKNATELTWATRNTISLDEEVMYYATITITDSTHATLDGHTINYVLTDDSLKVKTGETYSVYGTATIDQGNAENEEDIGNVFFFISDVK